jgi:hypothetical protein
MNRYEFFARSAALRWGVILLLVAVLSCVGIRLAEAQETRSATITFSAPTKYTDGSSIAQGTQITYRLYQGEKGQQKTLAATLTSTATKVSTGLEAGKEYCWQVTAVINGQESERSNEACKAFAFPIPETVTITVT